MKKRLFDKRKAGSAMLEVLFQFLIAMSLIFCFVAMWQPFIRKQNIDYMAKTLVRAVEANGRIDRSITELQEELEREMGISPTVTWEADYIDGTDKIQLKGKFKITVSDTVTIKLFEPTFTDPVTIDVPVSKTFTGISQVFWKTS